jgi:hypothetical protein
MITLSTAPAGKHVCGAPYWAFRSCVSGELIGLAYPSYAAAYAEFSSLMDLMGLEVWDEYLLRLAGQSSYPQVAQEDRDDSIDESVAA